MSIEVLRQLFSEIHRDTKVDLKVSVVRNNLLFSFLVAPRTVLYTHPILLASVFGRHRSRQLEIRTSARGEFSQRIHHDVDDEPDIEHLRRRAPLYSLRFVRLVSSTRRSNNISRSALYVDASVNCFERSIAESYLKSNLDEDNLDTSSYVCRLSALKILWVG